MGVLPLRMAPLRGDMQAGCSAPFKWLLVLTDKRGDAFPPDSFKKAIMDNLNFAQPEEQECSKTGKRIDFGISFVIDLLGLVALVGTILAITL